MYTAQQIIDIRKLSWGKYRDIERDRLFTEAAAKEIISSESLIVEIKEHPEHLIEMFFVIVDKDKKTVPFFLNEVQHEFLDDLNKAIEAFKNGQLLEIKILILKGRQQGFTTLITAYQLACTITRKNFEGFTAADEDNNTGAIFENKAKFPYSRLPDILKPTEKYNNKKQLLFEKLHSSWEVKTATKNMGRSRTINFFHGSEAAFWKDGIENTQAGLGEALTKDAIQILESTANGYNEFKDLWDSGNWTKLFFQWWKTKEYRFNFESTNKEKWFKNEVNNNIEWIYKRCKWLSEVIKLEWEQIYWYYNKWLNLKEKIKQEYPCTPDEAFLSSGNCVFDKDRIIERKEYLKLLYNECPPKRGHFYFEWNDPDTQDYIKKESIKWVDDPNGFITIYEDVQRGYPYVNGGDTKGEGKDFYTGTVINNVTGIRAATIRSQWTNSKPYTWQMYCLGIYYNTALIGIEMNFNTAPIEELQRLKYPKQYLRQHYDTYNKTYEKKFGWKTDGNTRPLIIDKEIDLIENNIDLFTDITMLDECLTFIYDKNGRPDAEVGKHDDLLLSDMIANEIRTQQDFKVQESAESKFPVNSIEYKVEKNLESIIKKKNKKGGWY